MAVKKDPPKSLLSEFMSGFKQGIGFSAPAKKKKKVVAPKKRKYVRRNSVRSNQK
jgi:hypothetical protein